MKEVNFIEKINLLMVVIAILGLIVSGCIPVVPPAEQDESGTLPNEARVRPTAARVKLKSHIFIDCFQVSGDKGPAFSDDFSVYKLFRGGVKWSVTPVRYYVYLNGAPDDALEAIKASTEEWDTHTSTVLFEYVDDTRITVDKPGDLEEFYYNEMPILPT